MKLLSMPSTGKLGALGELLASADLMKRGFEVYRAISPASSCDLCVIKNSRKYSVEVRTGHRTADGKIATMRAKVRADFLAVVLHYENTVVYEPSLPN